MFAKQVLRQLFKQSDVIPFEVTYWDHQSDRFGTGESRLKIVIHDEKIIDRMRDDLEIGFADSYVKGDVDVEGDIGEVIALAVGVQDRFKASPAQSVLKFFGRVTAKTGRRSLHKQREDVQRHYDLGNDFYRLWLDESMCYSCAYFRSADDSLETAQAQKIDHSLKKLRLKPGETLLDIGCGWGAMIIRAGQHYSAHALGVTLSQEQLAYACQKIHSLGLSESVDVKLQNYHVLAKQGIQFDKIVSIGMLEHVGKEHLADFAHDVKNMLKPGGLALLHFITSPKEGNVCTWMDKYIFPGAYLPAVTEVQQHLANQDLRILDVENLRPHYKMTLDHWSRRFEQNLGNIREMYGEDFVRMWRLYLRGCSMSFNLGVVEIHQILVSNGNSNAVPLTREDIYCDPRSIRKDG